MTVSYYMPDTNGTDPTYKVSNEIYTYFENGMELSFREPIFYDTLKIVSSNDGKTWADGINYVLTSRDYTAESRARNVNPQFNGRLARKVKLVTDVVTPYQISLTYQTLYPRTPTSPVDSADGTIDLTPGLVSDILKRLMSVEEKSLIVGSSSIPTDALISPLAEDINGTNDNNIITETHSVNTFEGMNTIFPQRGSFFKDSVEVTINGSKLNADSDYYIAGFDRYKTKLTSNRSGIYTCIVLLKDYAGDNVSVKYHAVGGTPTINDITRLQAGMKDILTYLAGTQYLTSDMLPSDPSVAAINSRVVILENEMRAFMKTPTYGRTTTGTTVARTLKAPDTGLHWWTIGSLYQADTSTEIFTSGTMDITIEMPDRHLRADLILSTDILNPTQPLKIAAKNVMYDQGYDFFGSTTASLKPPILFRIIYNQTVDNASGVLLQVGTSIPSLVERFGITDNSGVEGEWYLALPASSDAATPNDVAPITLPNSTRVWNLSGGQSSSAVVTMPLDEGYLAFIGTLSLSAISAPSVSETAPYSVKPVFQGWLPVTQATSIDVYYSGTAGRGKLTIPAIYDLNKSKVVGSTAVSDFSFADGSVGSLRVTLDNNNLTLYYTGATQNDGSFNINYVTLHTGNNSDKVNG